MNIIRNDKMIRRNARIATFTTILSIAVLLGGTFWFFRFKTTGIPLFVILLLGIGLSQIGMYYTKKFARKPRPDELIDQALKGLDNKYTLYHYRSPVSHLLVGPSGVWILEPKDQAGTIKFSNGRWKQKGGNLYMKIFAQESLGRPDLEILGDLDRMQQFFQKNLPEESVPSLNSALVFSNPRAILDIPEEENPPAETVYIQKLKDLVRKSGKEKSLSLEKVRMINEVLDNK